MIIDPNWQARIVAYRMFDGTWYTPEAIAFARQKPAKLDELADANPYTWDAIMRRAEAGRDVPAWLVLHVEGEMKLRDIA